MEKQQNEVRGSDVALGVAVPFVVSALWNGVVKNLVPHDLERRLFHQMPGVLIGPAVIVGGALIAALVLWPRRRGVSYGLLGMVAFALLLTLAFFVGRPVAPPPT